MAEPGLVDNTGPGCRVRGAGCGVPGRGSDGVCGKHVVPGSVGFCREK